MSTASLPAARRGVAAQRIRAVVIAGVAGAFAAAWRYDLFLVLVALPAGVLVVWVHERLAELGDARRAAALAVTAPMGLTDVAAVERIVAADLAALSLGDLRTVDDAITLAERTITDPWRRSLSCERLEAAKRVVAESGFAPPTRSARLLAHSFLRIAAIAALAGTLISITVWQQRLLLVPLALALTAVSTTLRFRRRTEQLRDLLVREAGSEPARGTVLVPDEAVVGAIVGLTHGRPRVHRAAVRLVAASSGPENAFAARRMARSAPTGPKLSELDRDLLAGVAVAVALVAALEAM